MPRPFTNSSTVVYHEDGSWTETNEITHMPVDKKQQALAIGVLSLIAVAPVLPLLTIAALDKFDEKRKARKARKADLKSV